MLTDPRYWLYFIVIFASLLAFSALTNTLGDAGCPGPHTCEEDEAQYVTPDGLACIPVDDTNLEEVARRG